MEVTVKEAQHFFLTHKLFPVFNNIFMWKYYKYLHPTVIFCPSLDIPYAEGCEVRFLVKLVFEIRKLFQESKNVKCG